jgi:hypothetical protein
VAAPERRYIRKRGAVRKYGLTPDQVEEAVKRGLITDCKLGDGGELRINEERALNQSYTLFMRSYKLLSDELERRRDELNTCRLAGLAALGLAVTAAALAVEGWGRALSLVKKAEPAKES